MTEPQGSPGGAGGGLRDRGVAAPPPPPPPPPTRPPGPRPDRSPVRARSGRRPLPPIIFILVLALGAAYLWVHVVRTDGGSSTAAACASTAATPSLAPGTVQVRVLNGTDQPGLANKVATTLRSRGLTVGEVGNDASGRTVTGVGEIRHGARGVEQARYLAAYLPGATDVPDTRATAQVDLVVGPAFTQLATVDQVAAAVSKASSSCAASG